VKKDTPCAFFRRPHIHFFPLPPYSPCRLSQLSPLLCRGQQIFPQCSIFFQAGGLLGLSSSVTPRRSLAIDTAWALSRPFGHLEESPTTVVLFFFFCPSVPSARDVKLDRLVLHSLISRDGSGRKHVLPPRLPPLPFVSFGLESPL